MIRATRIFCRPLLILGFAFLSGPAAAGEAPHPLRPSDTTSPRATLESFIQACEEIYRGARDDFAGMSRAERQAAQQRIFDCMDLTEVAEFRRSQEAKESALYLKEVLDRLVLPAPDDIPGIDDVVAEDGSTLDYWVLPETDIALHRVVEGKNDGHYLFSPETIRRANPFYELVKDLPYQPNATPHIAEWYVSEPGVKWMRVVVDRLPSWVKERVWGQAVWQWVALIFVVVASIGLMGYAYRTGRRLARSGPESGALLYGLTLVFPFIAVLIPFLARIVIEVVINITGGTLVIVKFGLAIVGLLAIILAILAAGIRSAEIVIASPRIDSTSIDAQLIRLLSRVLSLVAAVIVFLEGGRYLGIPITSLLAGAGVAGAAVALAAQDAIKNIFGSMMIILDKPYQIGERIIADDYDGVVEEIGLRSTKIRLLTGHQAIIPNEHMARSDIENVGRRPYIRRVADLPLPLDTTPEDAKRAARIVRDILADHEGMKDNFPPRVFLSDFQRDCLNLKFLYWYHPPNYWDFVAHGEEINQRILREFASAGITLALPATTTYLAQNARHPLELPVAETVEPKA